MMHNVTNPNIGNKYINPIHPIIKSKVIDVFKCIFIVLVFKKDKRNILWTNNLRIHPTPKIAHHISNR